MFRIFLSVLVMAFFATDVAFAQRESRPPEKPKVDPQGRGRPNTTRRADPVVEANERSRVGDPAAQGREAQRLEQTARGAVSGTGSQSALGATNLQRKPAPAAQIPAATRTTPAQTEAAMVAAREADLRLQLGDVVDAVFVGKLAKDAPATREAIEIDAVVESAIRENPSATTDLRAFQRGVTEGLAIEAEMADGSRDNVAAKTRSYDAASAKEDIALYGKSTAFKGLVEIVKRLPTAARMGLSGVRAKVRAAYETMREMWGLLRADPADPATKAREREAREKSEQIGSWCFGKGKLAPAGG